MIKQLPKKALIIDDEPEIGLLLGSQLKRLGIENNYAPNLTDGLILFNKNDFSIVFLDINLPDGNGLDVIQTLKKQNPETNIVVMSAYNTTEYNDRAIDLGAHTFIGKPFDSTTIKKLITECA